MILLRVLHAELLKLKRTIALKMVLLSPAVVVLLILFLASQAPNSTLRRQGIGHEWTELASTILKFWATLMLPLYIALETAMVAGVDHSGNQWKSLLARPVPRWTFYVAKLIVVAAMTAIGTLVLFGGILMDGAILPHIEKEVAFATPVPWAAILRNNVQVAGLIFPALVIQHWVSLRWRSFSVGIGTGIVATMIGFFSVAAARQLGDWPRYFPWALPMLTNNIDATLLIGTALALVAAAAGCIDFCRREIT